MTKTLCKVVLVAMVMGFVFASCNDDKTSNKEYLGEWKYTCEYYSCLDDTTTIEKQETGTVKAEEFGGGNDAIKFGNPINDWFLLINKDEFGQYQNPAKDTVFEHDGFKIEGKYESALHIESTSKIGVAQRIEGKYTNDNNDGTADLGKVIFRVDYILTK